MTRKLTDFNTLTFDCYGTLIDWETGIAEALSPWLTRHGLDLGRDELLRAFAEAEQRQEEEAPAALYPDILRGALGAIAARWKAPLEAGEADAFARSVRTWPAFTDSADALAYLERHYRLVILSNVDRDSFRHSNEKLGVEFDLIVTAEDVGSYKPSSRNFRYLLDKLAGLGVAQAEVLHCAQSLYHDHVPAKRLGLRTLWVNRRAGRAGGGATPVPEQSVSPDFEFPSMAAFADAHREIVGG